MNSIQCDLMVSVSILMDVMLNEVVLLRRYIRDIQLLLGQSVDEEWLDMDSYMRAGMLGRVHVARIHMLQISQSRNGTRMHRPLLF